MSEQQNLDVVRRGYDAFGRGDLDALLSTFDDDIEWTSPGPKELPTSGTRRGREQVRDFFRIVNELWDIQRFEPKTFVAQGDTVVVLGEDTAVFRPTNATLNEAWAHAFVLKNGKIVRFHEYIDTAAAVAELHASRIKA